MFVTNVTGWLTALDALHNALYKCSNNLLTCHRAGSMMHCSPSVPYRFLSREHWAVESSYLVEVIACWPVLCNLFRLKCRPTPCNRQHLGIGDCLAQDDMENDQNCSVLCTTFVHSHASVLIWAVHSSELMPVGLAFCAYSFFVTRVVLL